MINYKKLSAFLLVLVAICASAEAWPSLSDCPAEMQAYVYACEDAGIKISGSSMDILKINPAINHYGFGCGDFAFTYRLTDDGFRLNMSCPAEYKPWSYILALQYFGDMTFADATKLYCDLYLLRGAADAFTYKIGMLTVQLTGYSFSIEKTA